MLSLKVLLSNQVLNSAVVIDKDCEFNFALFKLLSQIIYPLIK